MGLCRICGYWCFDDTSNADYGYCASFRASIPPRSALTSGGGRSYVAAAHRPCVRHCLDLLIGSRTRDIDALLEGIATPLQSVTVQVVETEDAWDEHADGTHLSSSRLVVPELAFGQHPPVGGLCVSTIALESARVFPLGLGWQRPRKPVGLGDDA